jgi:hypothetical protein
MAKKYFEFLNDISKDELYDGMMSCGMFSERVVPIFSMDSFLNFLLKFGNTDRQSHDYVRYLANRNNQLPREIGIPNPFAYEELCCSLKNNFYYIRSYFESKTKGDLYKKSQIHIQKMYGTRALVNMNYTNWKDSPSLEEDLKIGRKYLVKTDISNCYPSIYTHSISWALAGKPVAKTDRDSTEWFNDIDLKSRNTTNGETHGILVGPHTSNLLSEIVLCAIDKELVGFDFIRHIDDYSCFCKTEEEAEHFLVSLQKELAQYDLLINNKKTSIIETRFSSTKDYFDSLRSFEFVKYDGMIVYSSIKQFFSLVDQLVSESKNLSLISYSWKLLFNEKMTVNAAVFYQKEARYYLFNYPYLFPFFEDNIILKFSLGPDFVKQIVTDNFQKLISSNNYEGVSYCLYYTYKYHLDIHDLKFVTFDNVSRTNDCICLLTGWLADFSNRQEYRKKAEEILDSGMFDRYWLFCYYALEDSDLPGQWKIMKKEKVDFLQPCYLPSPGFCF